jgi:hypothetical protein
VEARAVDLRDMVFDLRALGEGARGEHGAGCDRGKCVDEHGHCVLSFGSPQRSGIAGNFDFRRKPIVRGDRGTDRRSPLSRQVAPTTPGFEAAAPAKKAVTTHARKSRVRSAS